MFDSGWDLNWFKERVAGREDTFRFTGETCDKTDSKSVLDIGGGIGSLNAFLPSGVQHTVVDLSRKAKKYGEKEFPGVRFITGTVDDIVDRYDFVVALSLIEHLRGYVAFLRAAWDISTRAVCISFRNGLDNGEKTKIKSKDYWDNKYAYPPMESWIKAELDPSMIGIKEIPVARDYSLELVLVLLKKPKGDRNGTD